ncbi:hypothetical protein ACU4GI_47125 (plasmid) [Cupriavidus basilensis]
MDQKTSLVIKNSHRIEEVWTPVESRAEFPLRTALVSRLVRRDFHLVTTKMRVCAKQRGFLAAVRNDLDQLETEVGLFEAVCHAIHPTTTEVIYTTMQVRLVSADGARLFRLLRRVDEAYGCLYVARFEGRIDRDQQMAVLPPVLMAYSAVKASALQLQRKSAQELAAQHGVG